MEVVLDVTNADRLREIIGEREIYSFAFLENVTDRSFPVKIDLHTAVLYLENNGSADVEVFDDYVNMATNLKPA